LKFSFDPDQTRMMVGRAGRAGLHLIDVIAAAAARVATDWTGSRFVSLAIWNHGRTPLSPGLDLSREIGCFAYYWPLALDAGSLSDSELPKSLHQRRCVENPPLFGFKLGRYSGRNDWVFNRFKSIPTPEIHINFLGRYRSADAPGCGFRPALESPGPLRNAGNWDHFRVVGINAQILNGSLRASWSFSDAVYTVSEIRGPADAFRRELSRMVFDREQEIIPDGDVTGDAKRSWGAQ
jgi:hypothetical protein